MSTVEPARQRETSRITVWLIVSSENIKRVQSPGNPAGAAIRGKAQRANVPIRRQIAVCKELAAVSKAGLKDERGVSAVSYKPVLAGLLIIATVALGTAWFVFSKPFSSPADAIPAAGGPAATLTAWDRTLGNPKASVVLVEYASPQCKHCARFDMTYFPNLKKKYIDTGKIYFALRVFPLSAADIAVEEMARCLPADRYFQFLDLIWRNQPKWDPAYQVPDVHAGLVEMGRRAGMNARKVDSCIADQKTAAKISEVGNEATNKYGIMNVPTFLINGRTRRFTDDWDAFQKEIDSAANRGK